MSDFDRNVAAYPGTARTTAAVDAGLRAHMIRVYNYMAGGCRADRSWSRYFHERVFRAGAPAAARSCTC